MTQRVDLKFVMSVLVINVNCAFIYVNEEQLF